MTDLEGRYRRVLRLLPEAYRQTWEDDMVAAFLDSRAEDDAENQDDDVEDEPDEWALEDDRWPGLVEVASVVALATRLRLGAGPDATPSAITWGKAVRLAGLLGVLSNAVMIGNGLLLTAWLSHGFTDSADGPDGPDRVNSWPFGAPGVWHTGWVLLGCGWLAAYGALLMGRRRAGQLLALLAVVPQLVHLPIVVAGGDVPAWSAAAAYLSVDLLLIAVMTARPDGEAVARWWRWLLALPLGLIAVLVPLDVLVLSVPGSLLIDSSSIYCAVLTVAAVWYQVARRRQALSQSPQSGEIGLALILLAGTALALRALTLYGYHGQVDQSRLLLIAGVQFAVLLFAVLPLTNTTLSRLRHAVT